MALLLLVAKCLLFASQVLSSSSTGVAGDNAVQPAALPESAAALEEARTEGGAASTDAAAVPFAAEAELTAEEKEPEAAGATVPESGCGAQPATGAEDEIRSEAVAAAAADEDEDASVEEAGSASGIAEAAVKGAAAGGCAPSVEGLLDALEAAAAAAAAASDEFDSAIKEWSVKVAWLGSVLPAVELPGGPGSEQACAAARQQLLQLQSRLQQDMQEVVVKLGIDSNDSSSGSSSSGSASAGGGVSDGSSDVPAAGSTPAQLQQSSSDFLDAAMPAIAQQMVALGEALCAQFPLPHCCNNPGCVELRGASELQLVGGKGCVCSRCR
jgi:hypothetical protein